MKQWLPGVAIGVILALVALGAVLALGDSAARSPSARADALAAELRCPDCQGLSVADSPSRSAQEIRSQIDALIADGATDAEVRAQFVNRYGEWILLAPASVLAWLVPFGAVVAGIIGLAVWLIRHRATPPVAGTLSSEERRALRDEVDALDA